MARRHAVLMKLKDGVTKGEVKELCELLRRIGDPEWLKNAKFEEYRNPVLGDMRHRRAPHLDTPKTDEQLVHTYDDDHGCDPCWYIP